MPIRFGTYDIRNGRNGGLESVLRGVSQAKMDLGIFQETKVMYGIYTRGSAGYSVVATDASSRHRGGVAVFPWPALHFAVESVQKFGPNVIGFQLVTVARRWYIVGCYLAPDDTSTIERVIATLKERPKGAKLLVVGDLNANVAEPEGDRRGRISRRHWRQRYWRTCRRTSSCNGALVAGTGERGVCYERGWRCGPGRTTSWGRIAISLETSPSGTLETTHIITWFWVTCTAPP